MTSPITLRQSTGYPTQGPSSASSLSTVALPEQRTCTVYIGGEDTLTLEKMEVIKCLRQKNLSSTETNPSSATHFFLFTTDSFLKTKSLVLSYSSTYL